MSRERRPAGHPDAEQAPPRLLPPYHLILLNDDYHSGEFVVRVLSEVLHLPAETALVLALEAHDAGRAIVWTGPKEAAELKQEQILSFRERDDGTDLGPLHCVLEPGPA